MKDKLLVICMAILLLFSLLQCFLPIPAMESEEDLGLTYDQDIVEKSRSAHNPGSSWKTNSYPDFAGGNLEKIVIKPEGSLELEYLTKSLKDEFINEANISVKENVIVNTTQGLVKLGSRIQTFGGSEDDYPYKIIQTSDGGFAIIGDTISYRTGSWTVPDIWLIKTDSSGVEQWNKTYGGTEHDSGCDILQTSDGGYAILGYTSSTGSPDLWLFKTDSAGNFIWNMTYDSGAFDFGMGLIQTSDGGFAITGYKENMIFDADALIIKTDSNGKIEWNNSFGGMNYDRCYDIVQTTDGGYAIIGRTQSYGGGFEDAWLIKTNDTGVFQWNKTFGGVFGFEAGWEIMETTDNGLLIIGETETYGSGAKDGWMIKTDNNGVEQWNKTYGGIQEDVCTSIIKTPDGYSITGHTFSSGQGKADVWLIKTDNSGTQQWENTFGGSSSDFGLSLVKTAGGYTIVGDTESYGAGGRDIWLIGTDDNGNILNGTLRSTNLLLNEITNSIDSFAYTAELLAGNSIKVSFSSDGSTWYNSLGEANGFDTLSDGNHELDLITLAWSGSTFYYKMEFSTTGATPPIIDNIELKYSKYSVAGSYLSKKFNSVEVPMWKTITWTTIIPANTQIRFQLRSGSSDSNLQTKPFIGPDGTIFSNYTEPGNIYLGHTPDTWLQFKAYLSTTDITTTPILHNVTIIFNRNPKLDFPNVLPSTGDITKEFNFTVDYFDSDNDPPEYVSVSLDETNVTMYETDSEDTEYTDGKSYWYSSTFSAGIHTYQFFTSDSDLTNSTEISEFQVSFGALYHINIEPATITMTADDYQVFTAQGFDADDNLLTITPTWEVTGGGTIDQTGNFTATTPGTITVYANTSGISGNATVTITVGKLHRITITPQSASITTDEFLPFTATGYDADENEVSISPTWEVTGGGTIDPSGNFTATTPGDWRVFANFSGISGNISFTVTLGVPVKIIISPNSASVNVSESILFTIEAYDADNNELDITPVWEVSGGGTIGRYGKFTAKSPGTFTVYANASGISASATVTVLPVEEEPVTNGDKKEEKTDDNTMLFVGLGAAIVIIIIVIALLFLFLKKKRKGGIKPETEKAEEIPAQAPYPMALPQPMIPQLPPQYPPLQQMPLQPAQPPTQAPLMQQQYIIPQQPPTPATPIEQPEQPPTPATSTEQPEQPPTPATPTEQPEQPPIPITPTEQPEQPPTPAAPTEQPEQPPVDQENQST